MKYEKVRLDNKWKKYRAMKFSNGSIIEFGLSDDEFVKLEKKRKRN